MIVDLAVWVDPRQDLNLLRMARMSALAELLRDAGIGIAHHQMDVFLFEASSGRYLGRLCNFSRCPRGKPECAVPGCGGTLFVRQIEGFHLWPDGLGDDKSVVLFER